MAAFEDGLSQVAGFVNCDGRLGTFSVGRNALDSGRLDLTTLVVEPDLQKRLAGVPVPEMHQKLVGHSCGKTFALALQQLMDRATILSEAATLADGDSGAITTTTATFPLSATSSSSSSSSLPSRSISHSITGAYPRRLLNELEEIGWDRVESVSADLLTLTLKVVDDKGRSHSIEVTLSPQYPAIAPHVTTALPVQSIISWDHDSRLSRIVRFVYEDVSRYQRYFDTLDDVDSRTWVLEPTQPTYHTGTRRIAIEKTCSVIVDIDCKAPTALPDMRFLGSPERVENMKTALGTNLHLWNETAAFKNNIEAVLGITLLRPEDRVAENFSLECGICYSYLEGKHVDGEATQPTAAGGDTPDEVCPNEKCGRLYHHSCLNDWLQSLPTSRNSFGTLFGECPYCQDPISVRLA